VIDRCGGTISAFASTGIDDNAAATAMTIDSTGRVGVGTTIPSARLHVSGGQIVAAQNTVASGATVDFATGNIQVLSAPGGSAITLNNMIDGGAYSVLITDTTSRTYTFTNCTNAHFTPANGATTDGKHSMYTILKVTVASATHCYISWMTNL
jgi:hypothetical protein